MGGCSYGTHTAVFAHMAGDFFLHNSYVTYFLEVAGTVMNAYQNKGTVATTTLLLGTQRTVP
jgi:hypothetical protein